MSHHCFFLCIARHDTHTNSCAFYVPTKIPDCTEFYIEITTQLAPYVWWLEHDVMSACIPPSPPTSLLLTSAISLFRYSALSLSHCSFGAPQLKNIECVLSFVMWSILVDFSERGPGRAFFPLSLSLSRSLAISIHLFLIRSIVIHWSVDKFVFDCKFPMLLDNSFKSLRQFNRFAQLRSTQMFNVSTLQLHSLFKIHITTCFLFVC